MSENSGRARYRVENWVQYVVSDIEIPDGTCTMGLYADANSGNWGDLDDVELMMQ